MTMASATEKKTVALFLLNEDSCEESSEDEIEELIPLLVNSVSNGGRETAVRMPDYFENVVPRYSGKVFKSHFRLHRKSVEKLSLILSTSTIFTKPDRRGRPPVPLPNQICIFLWYASSQEPLRTIADRSNHTESLIFKIIRRVTKAIHEKVLPIIIKWPIEEEVKIVNEGFYAMHGLKGVIGAIDETQIAIVDPKLYNENYIIRKGYASIILQAVCDHNMKFTDCYTGWPGSVHDARVFDNCDLLARIKEDQFFYGT